MTAGRRISVRHVGIVIHAPQHTPGHEKTDDGIHMSNVTAPHMQ
jgi:hypothetical protein